MNLWLNEELLIKQLTAFRTAITDRSSREESAELRFAAALLVYRNVGGQRICSREEGIDVTQAVDSATNAITSMCNGGSDRVLKKSMGGSAEERVGTEAESRFSNERDRIHPSGRQARLFFV
jgi:hypothetical protein